MFPVQKMQRLGEPCEAGPWNYHRRVKNIASRNYFPWHRVVRSSSEDVLDARIASGKDEPDVEEGDTCQQIPECSSGTVENMIESSSDANVILGRMDVGADQGLGVCVTPTHPESTGVRDPGSFDGYLFASAVIVGSILGRLSSEELRYDASRLFRNQESSRLLNVELRRKRKEWKEQEDVRLAQEQRKRVEEVTEKARLEAERQKKMLEKYEQQAREEAERRRKEVEASRREYEETQRKLDLEYKERVKKEQLALEEARRLEREKREKEEREHQLELARKEEEKRRQEELLLRAKQEAAAARTQAKIEAEKEMSKFAVRMEGSVSVSVAPSGTLLPGPLREEARVRLSVHASSLLGGPGQRVERDYASIEDCLSDSPVVFVRAIIDACEKVVSALQLQRVSGEGPLMLMEKPEVDHWMHIATIRTALNGLNTLDENSDILTTQKLGPNEVILEQTFDCRTESGVLPGDHPLSYQKVFAQYLNLIIENPSKRDIEELFMEFLKESDDKLYENIRVPSCLSDAPRNLGSCLSLAHFIDRSLYTRPARESDAPAWFETCVGFSRKMLTGSFANALPDSLRVPSMLISEVLTPSHPVSMEVAEISDKNISEERKMEQKRRENARKAILAAKLLEEEWPDEEELRKARAKEREAKTPVTERIWALKNVASSLSMGSQGEMSRARQLLEQAVLLKQDMCESKDHPAVFPEALSLLRIIRTRQEWKADAAGVASLFLAIVMNISRGYMDIGDELSACAVLELALHEAEEVAGLRSTATIRGVKYLETCSSKLSEDQVQALAKIRENRDGIENFVTRAFTDELGAYRKDGTSLSKKDLWDLEGAAMVGPIHY